MTWCFGGALAFFLGDSSESDPFLSSFCFSADSVGAPFFDDPLGDFDVAVTFATFSTFADLTTFNAFFFGDGLLISSANSSSLVDDVSVRRRGEERVGAMLNKGRPPVRSGWQVTKARTKKARRERVRNHNTVMFVVERIRRYMKDRCFRFRFDANGFVCVCVVLLWFLLRNTKHRIVASSLRRQTCMAWTVP